MNDGTKTQHNQKCDDDKHNEHLCYLQCEGYHYGHKPEYKALVQDAQFMCQNCCCTAKRAENLCAPKVL